MDSEQLPTPESEEPKSVHREADGAATASNSQSMPPKEQVSILYKVKWEDIKDDSRTQEFVSEVPLGPLEVTTKRFDGTTLLESPPSSLPAIEIITDVEGDAPRITLVDESEEYSSDDSDRSSRSVPVPKYPRRHTRTKANYPVEPLPMAPLPDKAPPIRIRSSKKRYAPVAFKDITITAVMNTRIIINSEDLLKAIRGVRKYFPYDRLSGDSVTIYEPYHFLVHHLDELEDLQKQLGQEFDAMCTQIEVWINLTRA